MDGLKEYLLKLLDISRFFALLDYLVLIGIFLIILLIFLLGIALRGRTFPFAVLFLLSGGLIPASPFIYQWIMESYLKKTEFILTHNESLQYDAVYFVEGSFKNIGYLDFRGCVVEVNFIPKDSKKLQRIKYKINPRYAHIKIYKTPLNKQESMDFKLVIPSPNPKVSFDLYTKGACY
ncbi:DUF2393 family protein [Helicobacter turcicus]|uniref:DUF2393 domain-containing protein n=1 Tax=Helicobacter turcicus TaxID=2867412 RepID=A0ABS7JLA1_9HELI|nr:DUF2393 family protein [Helicobacter turcicus]MBX7490175.1 DUF2393 domain-containing protein [Helicobacter turcicus]MBX7545246.1 DUF2393 domain-containing protein [Helicobacter turcicus]